MREIDKAFATVARITGLMSRLEDLDDNDWQEGSIVVAATNIFYLFLGVLVTFKRLATMFTQNVPIVPVVQTSTVKGVQSIVLREFEEPLIVGEGDLSIE